MQKQSMWKTIKNIFTPNPETLDKVFSLGERPYYDENNVKEFANDEDIYQEPEEFEEEDPWHNLTPVEDDSKSDDESNQKDKSKKDKSSKSGNKDSKETSERTSVSETKNKKVSQIKKIKTIKPIKLIGYNSLNKHEENQSAILLVSDDQQNSENEQDKSTEQDKSEEHGKRKEHGKSKEKAWYDGVKHTVKPDDIKLRKEQKIKPPKEEEALSTDIQENICRFKETFNIPSNSDVIIREFSIDVDNPISAALIYIEGMGDRTTINDHILLPLMVLASVDKVNGKEGFLKRVIKHLLPSNQVEVKYSYEDILKGISTGNTALLIDGHIAALLIETKGYPKRAVATSQNEQVVRGPQEAFTDHLRTNTGLIRKRIKDERLITEMFKIGQRTNTDVAMMYIKDIANSKLVFEMRRRLKAVDTDAILDSGTLEQFITGTPFQLVPTILNTEKPDRACSYLLEGSLIISVDGDPYVIIMPVTFFSLLHSPEDAYLKWPAATFIRWFRMLASFVVLFLPAIYISVADYHEEMIPTDLLLAIAAARETVPYPVWVEVLFMEISFELIREAGLRIPSAIGPTIGIVGAIVLGQAAVEAGIVSPLLVIVVAITAIGSFAIPNYTLSFSFRLLRFFFILMAIMWGFYGLAMGVTFLSLNMVSLNSFGVPYFSGVAPYYTNHVDIISRKPIFQQFLRPKFLRTRDSIRQSRISRPWDPGNPLNKEDKGGKGENEK